MRTYFPLTDYHVRCLKFLILITVFFSFLLTVSSCEKKPDRNDPQFLKDKISLTNLSLAYLQENDLEEAEKNLKELIRLDPTEAMAYAYLGLVYLRNGNFKDAEKQLKKALETDPENPEIQMILAELHRQTGDEKQYVDQLKAIIETSDEFSKAYYALAKYYVDKGDSLSFQNTAPYLDRLIEIEPANIVPRFYLTELRIHTGNYKEALIHLEKIREIVPVFTEDAEDLFLNIKNSLQQKDLASAMKAFKTFHSRMKVTPYYIQDSGDLKGPEGENTGFPIITTSRLAYTFQTSNLSLRDIMKYTDATAFLGLGLGDGMNIQVSTVALADYDRDDDIDLYYSYMGENATASTSILYNNDMGSFRSVTKETGIDHSGKETSATFSDYNNDGLLDLFICMKEKVVLYEGKEDGTFQNVTQAAGLSSSRGGNHALFADLDHDGDLDIYISSDAENTFLRNNADGTFSENTSEMNIGGSRNISLKSDFGDFDEDGDLDLLVINEDGKNFLFTNNRHEKFEDIIDKTGIQDDLTTRAMALGDYNNDGTLDLFLVDNKQAVLYQNDGNGAFSRDTRSEKALGEIDHINVRDASFLDFDNDGFLDLLVAGDGASDRNVLLFHNDSTGIFINSSELLPETIKGASQIDFADFNEDGDLDIFLTTPKGVKLIRNESGFINHYFDVRLVGLSNGNGKNNRFGIGSKIEILAGDHYQMKLVKKPVTHFGIGGVKRPESMRVIWTNGVPQGIIDPKSNEDILEENLLKGSCPFLYTWNGRKYVFVKDIMWRSALGMPLGIMGDKTAYAFPDISKEYIKIPEDMLKAKDGRYSIRITEELWETVFFDKAALIAVDHPDSIDVFVDEKFVLPPFPGRELYQVSEKRTPFSAKDGLGTDLLSFIKHPDDQYVASFNNGPYQGLTREKELILDLGQKVDDDQLFLFLRGWIFPSDASINVAMSQTQKYRAISPYLQVINKKGEWETAIPNIGFPMGKDKTVIIDLSNKFPTEDRRIKIVTNMQIYWDHIFFSEKASTSPVHTTDLKLLSADLQFRGYSALYRKGGQYGPHWFDYYDVSKGQKWRDLTGNYTRYGDVKELLFQGDDKYIIANAGDEISLEFDTTGLSELPDGWQRDFLIYSEGWVKDGDLNTAYGKTVEPLPFRNMSSYPYGDQEQYPQDRAHQEYLKKYNTRAVSTERFRSALSHEK